MRQQNRRRVLMGCATAGFGLAAYGTWDATSDTTTETTTQETTTEAETETTTETETETETETPTPTPETTTTTTTVVVPHPDDFTTGSGYNIETASDGRLLVTVTGSISTNIGTAEKAQVRVRLVHRDANPPTIRWQTKTIPIDEEYRATFALPADADINGLDTALEVSKVWGGGRVHTANLPNISTSSVPRIETTTTATPTTTTTTETTTEETTTTETTTLTETTTTERPTTETTTEAPLTPLSVSVACGPDGGEMLLSNTNAETVQASISGPTNVNPVMVGGGKEITGLENGEYTVVTQVNDNGNLRNVHEETVTVSCSTPTTTTTTTTTVTPIPVNVGTTTETTTTETTTTETTTEETTTTATPTTTTTTETTTTEETTTEPPLRPVETISHCGNRTLTLVNLNSVTVDVRITAENADYDETHRVPAGSGSANRKRITDFPNGEYLLVTREMNGNRTASARTTFECATPTTTVETTTTTTVETTTATPTPTPTTTTTTTETTTTETETETPEPDPPTERLDVRPHCGDKGGAGMMLVRNPNEQPVRMVVAREGNLTPVKGGNELLPGTATESEQNQMAIQQVNQNVTAFSPTNSSGNASGNASTPSPDDIPDVLKQPNVAVAGGLNDSSYDVLTINPDSGELISRETVRMACSMPSMNDINNAANGSRPNQNVDMNAEMFTMDFWSDNELTVNTSNDIVVSNPLCLVRRHANSSGD